MSAIETESDKQPLHALLETWAGNEPMRHIQPLSWLVRKTDVDLRLIVEKLYDSYTRLAPGDPAHLDLENEFRALGRSLERLAEVARHGRPAAQTSSDLGAKLGAAITHAVASLNSLDTNLFGRRFPVQTHERSKAEPVYAALLVVMSHVDRLKQRIRLMDPGIDEVLLEGLVVREHPLSDEVLKPIA
ncbi:MAG: hypothetical protein ABI837_12480 [Acidobacteriota bacterium]